MRWKSRRATVRSLIKQTHPDEMHKQHIWHLSLSGYHIEENALWEITRCKKRIVLHSDFSAIIYSNFRSCTTFFEYRNFYSIRFSMRDDEKRRERVVKFKELDPKFPKGEMIHWMPWMLHTKFRMSYQCANAIECPMHIRKAFKCSANVYIDFL